MKKIATLGLLAALVVGFVAFGLTSLASAGPSPTPVVSSLSPTSGPDAGGTTVTITGSELTGLTAVSFGTTPATSFTVVNDNTVTAVAPPGSGVVDVLATIGSTTSAQSVADQFSYEPVVVSSLSPVSGPEAGGTSVTITGFGFTGVTAVSFGTTPAASFAVVNDNTVTAVTPLDSFGSTLVAQVLVTSAAGNSSLSPAFFTYLAVPTVSSVVPGGGPPAGATSVVISGTGLTAASAVSFGTTPATSFVVNSGTMITAVAPAGSGVVDVLVTTAGGQSAPSLLDHFSYVVAPVISALLPTGGPIGGSTAVTIYGSGFSGASSVLFGPEPATSVDVLSSGEITALDPAGTAGVAAVVVTTPGGSSSSVTADEFSYVVAPGTPGQPVATAGDGQATVEVATPSTGGTPTSYAVTAIDTTDLADGGQSCTVSGASGSCTVTGLINGDSYSFSSTATNLGGTSGTSVDSSVVTPLIPVVAAAPTTTTVTVPPSVVSDLSTFAERHGFLTLTTTCELANCDGSVNVSVARRVAGDPSSWTHLVIATGTFELNEGEHATLRLTITALGRSELAAHEAFWLKRSDHYRMTLTTITDGGLTIHDPVSLR